MQDVKDGTVHKRGLSARLLAFLLAFAMIVGVCPAVLADDVSYGNVRINDTTVDNTKVDSGTSFTINATVNVATIGPSGTEQDVRIYLGSSLDNIIVETTGTELNVTKATGGFTYTLMYDTSNGQYYVKVGGVYSGGSKKPLIEVTFKNGVPDGTPLNVYVALGGSDPMTAQNDNESSSRTVIAKSELNWVNIKETDTEEITIGTSASTLDGNIIKYTITETPSKYINNGVYSDSNASTALKDGEAALWSYTATDTLKLPDGASFSSESVAAAALSLPKGVSIKEYIKDGEKVVGIKLEWTYENTDTTKQAEPQTKTIILDSSKVTVDNTFQAGNIINSIETEYKTVEYSEDATVGNKKASETKTSEESSVETTISREGSGIGSGSKKASEFSGLGTAKVEWTGAVSGYVVEDDIIYYLISVTNDTGSDQTYTITDDLESIGLEFVGVVNDYQTTNYDKVTHTTEDGKDVFNITVYANDDKNAKGTLKIKAKVVGDGTGTIINNATIKCDSSKAELPVTAQEIPKQEKTPSIKIEKSTDGLSENGIYKDGESFYYIIKVTNDGTGVANDVNIKDVLPTEVTGGTPILDGTYTSTTVARSGNTISGTISGIEAKQAVTIKVPVTVASSTTSTFITNTAQAWLTTSDIKEASVTIDKNTASVNGLTISKESNTNSVLADENVTYTITIKNPSGNGKLDNATFYVDEVLPAGMEFVSASYKNTDNGTMTYDGTFFTFSGVNLKNGGSVSFDVVCKVTDSAAANTALNNTATLYGDADKTNLVGSATNSDVSRIDPTSSADVTIEKKAYDSNGNEVTNVKPGDSVTFKLTIKNNTKQAVEWLSIDDNMDGDFSVNDTIKIDKTENASLKFYDGTALADGAELFYRTPVETKSFKMVFASTYGKSPITVNYAIDWKYDEIYQNSQLTLNAGGVIVLKYNATIGSSFTGGRNTVTMETDYGTSVSYVDLTVSTDTGDGGSGDEPTATSNSKLVITKEAVQNEVSVSGTSADLVSGASAAQYKYVVKLKNTSEYDYTTTGAVFTDKIPDGMAFYIKPNAGSADDPYYDAKTVWVARYSDGADKVTTTPTTYFSNNETFYGNGTSATLKSELNTNIKVTLGGTKDGDKVITTHAYDSVALAGEDGKVECDTLSIAITEPITIKAGGCIRIEYVLTTSEKEVSKIKTEVENDTVFADRTYKNEVSFSGNTAFLDENDNTVSKITTVENVTLDVAKIHPGIEKKYTAKYGSTTLKENKNTITTDNDLAWTVTVYNGKTADGNGVDMSNYTVTEIYPDGFSYDERQKDENDETLKNANYVKSIKIVRANGAEVEDLAYVEPVNNVFTFGDAYTLHPGDKLVFTVLTKPNNISYGMYRNTVKLEVSGETIYSDAVVAGDYGDDEVTTDAMVAIYAVNTDAVKSVSYENATTGATLTASSTSDGDKNRVKAKAGDTVRYTLEVENKDSAGYLEDFTIIDRLPYSGDTGVVATGDRNSKFPVHYANHMTATVITSEKNEYDITNCIKTDFGTNTSYHFESTDLDWSYKSTSQTKVTWLSDYSQSTTLVRFAVMEDKLAEFGDVFKKVNTNGDTTETYTVYGIPAGATIRIEFDGELPAYIENCGSGNLAWNSFAYYFNSGDNENIVAEPGKVGVWVEDENYGGNILVRKIFKTNLNTSRTFFFAMYDAPYETGTAKMIGGVQHIDMIGNKTGAQAETNFVNIDISDTNTSYYIYETDANGKPLEADLSEDTTVKINDSESNIGPASKTVISNDGFEFTMDNTAQIKQKNNQKITDSDLVKENNLVYSKYLVWKKDLSNSKTSNSAIFTNEYTGTANVEIMGPFYADVPTSADSGASSDMTSTRPTSFKTGTISESTDSTKRASDGYDETIAGYGGDGVHDHTIATGFLAKITGVGTSTVESANWTITVNPKEYTNSNKDKVDRSNDPVYVRLHLGKANTDSANTATILYLDDYDLGEFIGDSDETTGVRIDADEYSVSDTLSSDENDEEVGEFVGDDESFSVGDDVVLSQYTAEEAAAIIAEGLELDPSNILWDENGSPYVIVDAELEAQAVVFSLDEKVSNMTDVSDDTSTVKTSASSFSGGAEAATEFTDYNKNGYAIYKLSSSSSVNYKLTLKDTLPHITLTDGAEVYIGIIVDQLYDRKATATLNLSETPEYEDFTVAEAAKTAGADGNNNLRYTHVDSSQVKNKDGEHTFNSNSTLYKFTKGASVVFNATAWKAKAGSSITENLMSPENTENSTSSKNILRVNATSAKSVKFVDGNRTIDDTSYTGYLSLAGTGQPSYRSVLVNVKVGQTITIVATSGGTSPRTLVLSGTDAKNPYETMTVPINSATTMSAYTNTWTSTVDGPVYIYSSGSGINIYEISVN